MTELDELAAEEERILTEVGFRPEFTFRFGDSFDPDDEDEYFENMREVEYVSISEKYAALLEHPTHGLEALKRGLYLSWFPHGGASGRHKVGPGNLVRFAFDFSPEAEWKTVLKLEERAAAWHKTRYLELDGSTMDQELLFMIHWYASMGFGYFQFDHFYNVKRDWNWETDLESVHSLIWSGGHPLLLRKVFSEECVKHRGLIGWYFGALLDEEARLVREQPGDLNDWMYFGMRPYYE
jgi:hypothetical protein